MFYLVCAFIGAISPAFPVVSVEAFAVFVGLFAPERPWWAVGLACALGQLACFTLLYLVGHRWVARMPWIQRRLARFDPGKYQPHARFFYASAAAVGVPPLNLLSIAAPLMQVSLAYFMCVAFLGRLTRLCLLVAFAEQVRAWVPVEDLPAWMQVWLA